VYRFQVHRGLHDIFFPVVAGGDAVRLLVVDKTVTTCVDKVVIGNLVAKP